LDTTGIGDEERFRPQARAAFLSAVATFAVAGFLALLGYSGTAAGLTWLGGGSLLLGVIYVIMYRV
jgi:hypothetical protein